jgi:hypothetical protein
VTGGEPSSDAIWCIVHSLPLRNLLPAALATRGHQRRTKQKPHHFLRLSCILTPPHRIFGNAILHLLGPHLPHLPSAAIPCRSPQPTDLARSQVLLKALSQRSTSGSGSLLCAVMSERSVRTPLDAVRLPFQSTFAKAKAPSSDARTRYALRHKGFQRLMAASRRALSNSATACQSGLQ